MIEELLAEATARGWSRPDPDPDHEGGVLWHWTNGDTGIKHAMEAQTVAGGFRIGGRVNVYKTAKEAADAIMEELHRHYEPGLLRQFGMKREIVAYGNPLVLIDKVFTVNDYGDILRQHGIW